MNTHSSRRLALILRKTVRGFEESASLGDPVSRELQRLALIRIADLESETSEASELESRMNNVQAFILGSAVTATAFAVTILKTGLFAKRKR